MQPAHRDGPVLVLVGPPGAGKTTVGRLVAGRLGVTFRDTDADVETAAGETVPEIFVRHGEDHFRALERDAVSAALTGHDGVLAVGGGAVLAPGTRALLAGRQVVHLDVAVPDAARRVGLARDRPLLLGSPRAQLGVLLAERAPLYAEVAGVRVDTSGRTPTEVAEAVLATLAPVP